MGSEFPLITNLELVRRLNEVGKDSPGFVDIKFPSKEVSFLSLKANILVFSVVQKWSARLYFIYQIAERWKYSVELPKEDASTGVSWFGGYYRSAPCKCWFLCWHWVDIIKSKLFSKIKSTLFKNQVKSNFITITILTISNMENQFVPCLWLLSLSGWYTNQYTHGKKLPPQSYYPGPQVAYQVITLQKSSQNPFQISTFCYWR